MRRAKGPSRPELNELSESKRSSAKFCPTGLVL